MFNLIVVAIAVVLVGVIAVASLWYGGDVFSTQTQKTDYLKIEAAASQIKGAMELHRAREGFYPALGTSGDPIVDTRTMLQNLTTGPVTYLSSIPAGDWIVNQSGFVSVEIESEEECERINLFAGQTATCPDCSAPSFDFFPACQVP